VEVRARFLALYADPRGFNLGNDLAHGLLGADRMTMTVASRVLHTCWSLGFGTLSQRPEILRRKARLPKSKWAGSSTESSMRIGLARAPPP
jgi:Domain of unknown function (DUF4209)